MSSSCLPGTDRATTENHRLLGNAAGNSMLTLVGTVVGKILFFVTQIVIVRIFGPMYYGLLFIGLRVTELARIFSSVGLPKGGMRFLSVALSSDERADEIPSILFTAFALPLIIGIPMSAVLIYLAPDISVDILRSRQLTPYLRLLAAAVPFAVVTYLGIELSRAFRTTKYAVLIENVVLPAGRLVFFGVAYLFVQDFISIVLATALTYVFGAVLAVVVLRRQFRLLYHNAAVSVGDLIQRCNLRMYRPDVVSYSFPLFISGCSSMLMASTDTLMLSYFNPTSDVGIYAAALTLAITFSSIMIRSMHSTFAPAIAGEFGRGNTDGLRVMYLANIRWMLYLAMPLTSVMILARQPLLLVYGKEFQAGATALAILCAGQMLNCATGGAGLILSMTGHQKKELAVNISSVLMNIVLNFIMIPRYGIVGAAWATTLSHVVLNIVPLVMVKFIHGIQPITRRIVLMLLGWIVIMGISLVSENVNSNLIIHAVVAVGTTLLIVIMTWKFGLLSEDMELFGRFTQKLRGRWCCPRQSGPERKGNGGKPNDRRC